MIGSCISSGGKFPEPWFWAVSRGGSRTGADRYLDTYRISNIQLTGRRYTLRIVSDERPDERAESVPPRLEEAYIYLTGGNRDDAPEG